MCCCKNCDNESVISVCVPIELIDQRFNSKSLERVCYLDLCEEHVRILMLKFIETFKNDKNYSYDFLNSVVESMQVSPNG